MLDFTKKNEISESALESLLQTHGSTRVTEAMKAIELAESYPVRGGDFIAPQENTWYSAHCKVC